MPLEVPGSGWGPLIDRALGSPGAPAPWAAAVSRYLDEVVLWNQKTDLTAARSPEELVDLTIADARVIAEASPGPGAWVDVGSGAGAPGLVLAMMLPEVRMTLVEPKDRRVAFLRSAIGKFGPTGTVVERGRSDRLGAAQWDTAVSRATLPPPEWLREGARLARRFVWVLLAREEPPVLAGLRVDADVRYEWPLTAVPRRAVRYVRDPAPG
jgi:16S rRNA (guanine527-N7)-methyltransferase